MAGLDAYDSVIEMAATARTFGVTQITVDQFLRSIQNQASSAAS
jgi:hypothetical protein